MIVRLKAGSMDIVDSIKNLLSNKTKKLPECSAEINKVVTTEQ